MENEILLYLPTVNSRKKLSYKLLTDIENGGN
jgi:hypothetical protein